MKKRLLTAVVAGVLAISTVIPVINVSATPEKEVDVAREKYEELRNKVEDINEEVQALDAQINSLVTEINKNKEQIGNLSDQIESTNIEIEQSKVEISEQEDVLGQRLREVYKSGGQTSYISIIFSADSFGDLISKIDSTSRIINLDQKVVNELVEKKEELGEKASSLEAKQNDIIKLNEDINVKAKEEGAKKSNQEQVLSLAKSEQAEFDKLYLAEEERKLVQGMMSITNNSNSSTTELDNAITQLRAIRKQIKSPTVDKEIVNAIEKGKTSKSEKEAALKKSKTPTSLSRGEVVATGSVQAIIDEAYKHIGKAYVYGAAGPSNFDCSGFTSYVYRVAAGINIGRSTYNQIGAGREVSYADLEVGDLIFPHADHVGIYIGGGMMIHSPQTGDVLKVAPVYRFWRARRIL